MKLQILTEIPGDGFCLYLLLSPHNVELLEEEEPRHSIRTGLFLFSPFVHKRDGKVFTCDDSVTF